MTHPRFCFSHAARYSERSSDSGQDAAGSQVCPFQRISVKLHADKGGCLITYYLFHTLYIERGETFLSCKDTLFPLISRIKTLKMCYT